MEEKRCWDDLPEECWEIVLARHPHQHLESVSLVCKRFLYITNCLRHRLTITDPTVVVNRSVSRLLRRFHQVRRIDLVDFHGDINQVILEIACSDLKLEALNVSKHGRIAVESLKELGEKMKKSLKSLICSRVSFFGNTDLHIIALYFPYLEELNISYPQKEDYSSLPLGLITDAGIEVIASNLRKLRKINISGNNFITDRSLRCISKKCEFLSEIELVDCCLVSEDGISGLIRDIPNLVCLSTGGTQCSMVEQSFSCAKALLVLSFAEMTISNEFLLSIEEADLSLEKLVLSCCNGFTFIAISSLLPKYKFLTYLDLEGASFLSDHQVESLSDYFHSLAFISLNSCSKLTISTFFTLVKNCASLEEIQMERTGLGKESSHTEAKKNSRIRSLKLAGNEFLGDECLKKLVSVCPNLESLDISHCSNIKEQGIQEVGISCSKISELQVNGCRQIKNIGSWEFSKLEVLRVRGSGINDNELPMVGKYCSQLLCLDLEGCSGVSNKGVKEAVGSCKRLREVSLKNCGGVSIDVVAWMVFSRPTLRKIVPPPGFVPAEKQRDLFLRHGCMVYNS